MLGGVLCRMGNKRTVVVCEWRIKGKIIVYRTKTIAIGQICLPIGKLGEPHSQRQPCIDRVHSRSKSDVMCLLIDIKRLNNVRQEQLSDCPYGCRGAAAAAVEILSSTRVHVSQSTTELTDFQMPKLLCPLLEQGNCIYSKWTSLVCGCPCIYQGRQPRAQI